MQHTRRGHFTPRRLGALVLLLSMVVGVLTASPASAQVDEPELPDSPQVSFVTFYAHCNAAVGGAEVYYKMEGNFDFTAYPMQMTFYDTADGAVVRVVDLYPRNDGTLAWPKPSGRPIPLAVNIQVIVDVGLEGDNPHAESGASLPLECGGQPPLEWSFDLDVECNAPGLADNIARFTNTGTGNIVVNHQPPGSHKVLPGETYDMPVAYAAGTPLPQQTYSVLALAPDDTVDQSLAEDVDLTWADHGENCDEPVATVPDDASKFIPAVQKRIMDTRDGTGVAKGSRAPGSAVTMKVAGVNGVPADATAVLLNTTVAQPIQRGWVRVSPFGQTTDTSNLNVPGAGVNISNLVVVPIGAGGRITFLTQAGGHLLADLLGYYSPSEATDDGRFVALNAPKRVQDTRKVGGKIAARATRVVPVASVVPATASAVVVNLTATQGSGNGYLQAYPTGQNQLKATSSNINFRAGESAPNLAIVPLGTNRSITLYAHTSVHAVVDVIGYVTNDNADESVDGLFVPFGPKRLVDSRKVGGALPKMGQRNVDLVGAMGLDPGDVSAVFLNATLVNSLGAGWMQLYPQGQGTPGASSTVNVSAAGMTRPNAAVTGANSGRATVVHHAGGHFVLDAAGYFTTDPSA